MNTNEIILNTLKEACKQRNVCSVLMEGEPERRFINPHGLCYTKKGKLILVCIQVKGYTKSNNPSYFRNLDAEKIKVVEVQPKKFTIDPEFNPDNDQYSDWLFHVLMKVT
jgi:hypothetical protein